MRLRKKELHKMINLINQEVFDYAIDTDLLSVKNKKKDPHSVKGWFYPDSYSIVIIESEHNSRFEIFETVAHELIHAFQNQLELPLAHNAKFFKFYKNKICKQYGFNYNTF